MKKVKILILGGTSFLGYNFSKMLSYNHEVLTTYRKKNSNVLKKLRLKSIKNKKKKFDIYKDKLSALKFNPDVIINCLGNTKNYNNHKFNKTKSLKIFQNFLKNITRLENKLIIHAGSDQEKISNSPYGNYKLYETNQLLKIQKNLIVILRIASLFGNLNKKNNIFDIVKNNKKHLIKNYNKKISFIDIEDLGRIIKFLINKKNKIDKNLIINCNYSKKITPVQILKYLNRKKLFKKEKSNLSLFENINKSVISYLNITENEIASKLNKYLLNPNI